MIPVSTTWQEAIRQQFRYQGYLKVTIEVTPPDLQENIQIASPDTDPRASIQTLVVNKEQVPTPYATLERNRWLLNGKFKVLPTDATVNDWWSTRMDGSTKVITFTFDKTYTIPGLYAEWDVVNGTYPELVTLQGFGLSGEELYSYNVENVTSAIGMIDAPMDNVKSVVLTIGKWNCPTWRARINKYLFGLYASYSSIDGGRVVSAASKDAADPLAATLPKHTLEVSLRNIDGEFDPSLSSGVSKYLDRRQLVKYQWGFEVAYGQVEWAPEMEYYIDEISIPPDSKEVSITSTSRLALMTADYKKSPYDGSSRTFYDLAIEILQNSDIIKEGDTLPWSVSEVLKNFSTEAPMPIMAANKLLQLIAGATATWLITNPTNGFVTLTDTPSNYKVAIDKLQQLGDPEFVIQKLLYSVSVGVYKYTKDTDQLKLSEGTYTVTGTQSFMITYRTKFATGVTCSVDGATLVQFTPYSGAAEVTVTSIGSTSEATIVLNGYEVTSSVAFVELYHNNNITHGVTVEIDNQFVTNMQVAKHLVDWVVNWYSKRQKLIADYTGFPELTVGDKAVANTAYGVFDNLTILSNEINFNGGFDGVLEVM